jgi:hypothetical protein
MIFAAAKREVNQWFISTPHATDLRLRKAKIRRDEMSKFDTLEFQRMFGSLPSWLTKSDNVTAPAERSPKAVASDAYRRAVGHYQTLRTNLAAIDSDEDLSAKGKAKRKAEAVTAFKKQIDQIRNVSVHKLQEKRKSLTDTDAKLSDVEKMTNALRQAQIIQHLSVDPLQNWATALEALENGDIEVAEAITTLPSVHPGRLGHEHQAELSQHLVEAKLRYSAPQRFTEYNELGEMLDDLDDVLTAIDQELAQIDHDIAREKPTPAEFAIDVDEAGTEVAESDASADDSDDEPATSGDVSDAVSNLINTA